VFTPRLDESFVASLDEVRQALASGSSQVVDARPADRFRGEAREPRPGVKSGHMPGSLNLPFVDIIEHGRLKPPEALKAVFAAHKIDLAKPIITSCGSGVTAAIMALAVEEAGGRIEGLYDGSWAEWGGRDDCAVATGPA
jgi:thiosulfate/3-mercaptopyruvate sulfurtransferase